MSSRVVDLLVRILGRRGAWRLGRSLYLRARADSPNIASLNGEERVQRELLARFAAAREDLVAFDVGANVGDWTWFLLEEASRLQVGDPKAMMEGADSVRDRLGSGVALLAAEQKGKASLVLLVTKDLTDRLDAVQLIRKVAPAVGARGGGGRPDLARTGGPDPSGIDRALSEFYDVVASVLQEQAGG